MTRVESEERLKEIRDLYEVDHMSIQQIADRFKVSRQAIHERLVRDGVKIRPRMNVRKTLNRELLTQLYVSERLPLYKIARAMKTTCSLICRELERYGIDRRPRGVDWRSQSEMDSLCVGDFVDVRCPRYPRPFSKLYGLANVRNMKISIRRVDAEFVRVTRIG